MAKQQTQTIAILPLGACEHHGPHLPLETDTIIAREIASRLANSLPPSRVHILPTEDIGYSVEHMEFAGSKTFSYNQAIERWLDIIENQYKNGIRKILLLNAHGGNSPLLTIVATQARIQWNMLVVVTHWTRFGLPQSISSQINNSIDIHAGEIETSVMLSIAPERVDMKAAKYFPSRQEYYSEKFKYLRAYGPHAFGWKMNDLNQEGVVGYANRASREKGHLILDHALYGLTELVKDMIEFDVSYLK